jgi:hypothetical protein
MPCHCHDLLVEVSFPSYTPSELEVPLRPSREPWQCYTKNTPLVLTNRKSNSSPWNTGRHLRHTMHYMAPSFNMPQAMPAALPSPLHHPYEPPPLLATGQKWGWVQPLPSCAWFPSLPAALVDQHRTEPPKTAVAFAVQHTLAAA